MFVVKMAKSKEKKEEKGKLIILPDELWATLALDAERCKRSVTRQIEAILSAYFEIGNIELNREGVAHSQVLNNYISNQDAAEKNNSDEATRELLLPDDDEDESGEDTFLQPSYKGKFDKAKSKKKIS